MAFLYLDDDAFPLATDDGPHSSAAMLQLLRNVEAIHQERFQKCGVGYRRLGTDSSVRLCSAWPVAWGPKWMFFHPSEAISTATVRLRIDKVELSASAGAGSGDLMRVCVTTGDARGRMTVPPFEPGHDVWNEPASGGETLAATTTDATLELTVRVDGRNQGSPDDPLAGWVAFYLWTWSIVSSAAEASGEITEEDFTTGAIGVEWFASGPASTTNPVERCVAIRSRAGSHSAPLPGAQMGDVHQIGYYRTTGLDVGAAADAALYLSPPLPAPVITGGLFTSGPQADVYTMGVLALNGLSIAADRPAFPIAEAGVYTDEPIRWQTHQTLAQELARLVSARVPVWCFEPARDKDVSGSTNWTPWRLLSQDLRQIADNGSPTSDPLSSSSGTPSTLAACPVANPPPSADLNGYRAIVNLVALRARGSGVWTFQPRVKLRLAAYDWTGSLVVAGDYTDWLRVAILNPWQPGADWLPLAHNVWGATACDDWQLRGCLVGNMESASGSDWQRFSTHVLTLPETSITYPAVIRVQAYIEFTSTDVDLAVLGFGLASRSYAD